MRATTPDVTDENPNAEKPNVRSPMVPRMPRSEKETTPLTAVAVTLPTRLPPPEAMAAVISVELSLLARLPPTALWPAPEHELVRLIDSNTQKGFLLIYRGGRILPFVASLSYSPGERHFVRAALPLDVDEVRAFVDSTAVFLFLHNEE